MFWKKKPVKYTCVAPNYFDVVNDKDGLCNDDYKEQLVEAYENQIFFKEEILEASELISFDLWNGLIWANAKDWFDDRYGNPQFKKYLRLNFFLADVPDDTKTKILDAIDYTQFYTAADLVQISKDIGVNLMTNCNWTEFVEAKFEQKKTRETLNLFLKIRV